MTKKWELLALAKKDCGRRIFTQFCLSPLTEDNITIQGYLPAFLVDLSTDDEQGLSHRNHLLM